MRDVECDELWSFIGKKQKRLRNDDDPNKGDCYTFVAIERHSKLVLNIAMGKRPSNDGPVCRRSAARHDERSFQITTDGFAPYKSAITTTLGDRCDYAMLIKVYKAGTEGEGRYSPAEVASVAEVLVSGRPDPERIGTSIVERSNLSTRMAVPRFTRFTNAFSKVGELGYACGLVCVLQFLPR